MVRVIGCINNCEKEHFEKLGYKVTKLPVETMDILVGFDMPNCPLPDFYAMVECPDEEVTGLILGGR